MMGEVIFSGSTGDAGGKELPFCVLMFCFKYQHLLHHPDIPYAIFNTDTPVERLANSRREALQSSHIDIW